MHEVIRTIALLSPFPFPLSYNPAMSPEQFVANRRGQWERLSDLVDLTDKGVSQLAPAQVAEIGRLYRATTSDLAIAQRDYPRHEVASFLNQLVARAHAAVYRGDPFTLKQLLRFFTHVMPQTFRETWRYFAVASLIFWLPFVGGLILVATFPETASLAMPAGTEQIATNIIEHEPWFYFEGDEQAQFSAFIATNNVRVSILAFAGGMAAGFLTVFVLMFNGLTFGSLFGFAIHHDFFELVHFAIGHGVIELNMICLAGAAGLMLGWAIVRPGYLSRRDALFVAGRKALVLLMICAIFLVVAGLIEGFISPREFLNPVVKWATGIVSGMLMFAYLLLFGRQETS